MAPRIDPVALGMALGFVADRLVGDPHRLHPVAGFGALAAAVERRWYSPTRARGLVHVGVLVGATAALARMSDRLPRMGRLLAAAFTTWSVLGSTSLEREAEAIEGLLLEGDLDGARARVRNLVGRDPSDLRAEEIARACVESIAENSADAVVAPLFWGAVAGLPGLAAYRAVNTLDAMVGHRTDRYAEYGWAAARLDDLANWVPARLTVVLTAGAAPPGRLGAMARAVCDDAPAHPSPNAGPIEAAWAGALGIRLGGRNSYGGRTEDRGVLGDGSPVGVADIRPATSLLRRVSWSAAMAAVGLRSVIRRELR